MRLLACGSRSFEMDSSIEQKHAAGLVNMVCQYVVDFVPVVESDELQSGSSSMCVIFHVGVLSGNTRCFWQILR